MIVTGEGRTALVVEDEASVLDLIVTILSQTGWRVDVATGGREGLERVRRQRYDLIVSDIRMPRRRRRGVLSRRNAGRSVAQPTLHLHHG